YLKYLNEKHDLKVLFLVRDVRSWSYSRHLQNRKPILLLALQWYLENRKLLFRFRKMGIPFMLIGYEEIALYPEHVMPLISRYLDIPYEPVMLEPDKSKSHIISGNIARVDALKRRRFIYDARWMLSLRINLFSPLLSLLNGWSKKYVYSNISGQNRDEFFLFGTGRRAEMTRKYN
ncbi:MAG: hypothetical protein JXR52_03160, partial [Bacteroidales bacterium]|nr:hypothetical protein [Bacteroidales bacterium]